jgi:hypothetical protein
MTFFVPVMGKALRKRRIRQLVEQLGGLEAEMRDVCAALVELTDHDDDLHASIARLLQSLDG